MADAPKSAFDIVMERLRKQDEAAGGSLQKLTDDQRAAIAEVRRDHEARAAQRRIMHQSEVAGARDRAELEERQAELRRDLDRFERERDEKIMRIRSSPLDGPSK